MTSSALWQHPYVNIFRHFEVSTWKKSAKEGDVTSCMDKGVKGTVYKLTGVIPANNYIQLPKTGSQSLGLTGRHVYVTFRPLPDKYFVGHLDVASTDGLVIRISFSNLFKEFKSTSTWLQFPFVVSAAHNTVEDETSKLSKQVIPGRTGPAPPTTRWTLLSLDLQYILSVYLNRGYSHVKTVRMCANTLLKGIYTSDNYYEPGLTGEECTRLGLTQQGICPLPRELSFPLKKNENWHELYDLIRFPCDANKKPFDSLQKYNRSTSPMKNGAPGMISPQKIIHPRKSATSHSAHTAVNKTVQAHRKKKSSVEKPTRLPEVGLEDLHILREGGNPYSCPEEFEDKQPKFARDEPREVHVLTSKTKKKVKCMEPKKVYVDSKPKSSFPLDPDIPDIQKHKYKCLQPDPILKLKRIIGFGGASMNQAIWTHGAGYIVYPCHAVVVAIHVLTGRQRFFVGHTDKISCIAMTRESDLLASGQTGQNSSIRVWNFKTGDCMSVFKVHASALNCLSFAENGCTLSAAGRDTHNKTLVAVWNTSRVLKGGDVCLIAKAHTEVDIVSLKASPFDECRMVSCGRNNIRIWRLKDNSLRSAAIPLGEHHIMEFTDICWDFEPTVVANIRKKPDEERKIYACSRTGHIFEIDHRKMSIIDVHRLMPRNKNGEKQTFATGCGLSVNSIYANDTFCVTGSSDGFLRVWPLDFKHIYLEAEHDGPVSVVQMSDNGLKILAGTSTGNLGVLDVTTRSYQTLMRSHTDRVLHMSVDVFRRHVATVSADHTIRIWSLQTSQQLYDFNSPNECPTTLCYHPSKQMFAVGFDNGMMRVFDIQATSLVTDHSCHKGPVIGLAYKPDSSMLYSAGADGSLCSYDATDDAYTLNRLLGGMVAKGTKYGPDCLSVSPQGHFIAFVGPQNFTVTVVNSQTLDEVMRIDVTSGTAPAEACRGLIDTACRVFFTPSNVNHLLVTTESSRLIKYDAPTGKLISEVSNLHRQSPTSLEISRDGKHLVTSGDKVIKVWDYNMRLDINFQVFIGQCEPITKLSFSPCYKELLSCGEAIFIWDFLGQNSSNDDSIAESENMLRELDLHGYETLKSPSDDDVMHLNVASSNKSPCCPKRSGPESVTLRSPCVTSDPRRSLEASYSDMPRSNVPEPLSPHRSSIKAAHVSLTPCDRRPVPEDRGEETLLSRAYGSPKSAAASKKVQIFDELSKPQVKRAFMAKPKSTTFAQKRFVAPDDQAGLRLKACMGYNGNGRDNIIWQPETGFFAYSSGCVIVIEDLKTSEQKHLLGHVEEISTLCVQSDCLEMASASGSRGLTCSQLCIWDLSTMTCRKVINDHEYNIVSLAYSRDDRFLVSIGDHQERKLCVWETSNCSLVASTVTASAMYNTAWNPQAFNEFITVGERGAVLFWVVDELTTNVPRLRVQEPSLPEELQAHGSKIHFTSACYAGDKMLYIGSSIGVITAWETRKNNCVLHWEADQCEITSLVAKRGRLITGSTAKKCLRLWSIPGVSELQLPGNTGCDLATVEVDDEISLDGIVVAMAFDDTLDMGIVGTDVGTLWYINWAEHSSVRLVTTNLSQINAVEFSEEGKFVTCADDGSIRLWSLEDREQVIQMQVLQQKCLCAAFAPVMHTSHMFGQEKATFTVDGKRVSYSFLAAGYSDGTLRVFDMVKAEMVMKIQPHRAPVTAVTYGAASTMISGDEQGFIALTSTLTGMTTRIINDHKGAAIHNFDVSKWPRDGSYTKWLACSADRRVSIWNAEWERDSCILGDWLTFPAPAFTPDGKRVSKTGAKAYYESLPPSIARFSTTDADIVVYTGYGMTKSIQFYDLKSKSVIRNVSLTHWATCLAMSPVDHLLAAGINERLLKLIDYDEGTFQDYTGSDDTVAIVNFTQDGRHVVSVHDKCMLIWEVMI